MTESEDRETFVSFSLQPDSVSEPPGRDIAERLVAALQAKGLSISKPLLEYDTYGWDFEVEAEGARIWCMLQESDQWLLITGARRSLWDRFMGHNSFKAHQQVVALIRQAVESFGARHVRVCSRLEFDMLARGPDGLLRLLRDRESPDRDDAARWLGSFDDPEVEAALLEVAADPRDNDELGDPCGESLSEIWQRRGYEPTAEQLSTLVPEALKYLRAAHPEWFRGG